MNFFRRLRKPKHHSRHSYKEPVVHRIPTVAAQPYMAAAAPHPPSPPIVNGVPAYPYYAPPVMNHVPPVVAEEAPLYYYESSHHEPRHHEPRRHEPRHHEPMHHQPRRHGYTDHHYRGHHGGHH